MAAALTVSVVLTAFELATASAANAGMWVVTSSADTGGACTYFCTLRAAISAANSSTGGDQITFNIAPNQPSLISVGAGASNPLPAITGSDVTIDAMTQPGTLIRLDDPDVGGGESGFVVEGQRVAIKGFRITRFDAFGILIHNGSESDVVIGNWIGTADGVTAAGTGAAGILIDGGTGGNTIDHNVLAGASAGSDGIDVHNSSNNILTGNYVGMTADGFSRLPNADTGIEINGDSQRNRIGGVTAAERNVVSGNSGIGVQLLGILQPDGRCQAPQNNLVEGNYLGVNAAGKKPSPYGNQGAGLEMGVCAQKNTVGGTAAGAANVASGNHDDGIQLDGGTGPAGTANVCNNTIQGNIVGLDPSGSSTRPNVDDGIDIGRGSCNNLVGGSVTGARNIVGGNQSDGVDVHEKNDAGAGTNGNSIVGNLIGLAANGSTPVANLQNGVHLRFTVQDNRVDGNVIAGNGGSGVLIETASARSNTIINNTIGTLSDGTTPRGNDSYGVYVTLGANGNRIEANTIAGNALDGVAIEQVSGSTTQTRQNPIIRNRIWSDGGLGIDLLPGDGVNPNDGTMSTAVGNLGLDFPVITQATTTSAKGTAPPGSVVELFSAQPGAGETYGEGAAFAGSVTTSSGGTWCIDGLSLGSLATATATDASGNTSEFAINVAASGSLSLCASPPRNTSAPTISGVARVAQALTAGPGGWSGTQPLSFGFQWERCDASGGACVDISGATGESYLLTRNDVGSMMRVLVAASNSAGSASAQSMPSAIVLPAPRVARLPEPTIIRSWGDPVKRLSRNANLKKRRFRARWKPFSRSTRVAFGAVFRNQKTTSSPFRFGGGGICRFQSLRGGVFMVC
jgi:CSLREA domain-containing protein